MGVLRHGKLSLFQEAGFCKNVRKQKTPSGGGERQATQNCLKGKEWIGLQWSRMLLKENGRKKNWPPAESSLPKRGGGTNKRKGKT